MLPLTLTTMSCISLVSMTMFLVSLLHITLWKFCLLLTQKRITRLSIDNYFSFFGRSVYLSGNSGLQVIVKGWLPKRCSCLVPTDAPIRFDYDSFDDACNDFCNLVKELINYGKSS